MLTREKQGSEKRTCFQPGERFLCRRQVGEICCIADLQLALGTVLTREHIETEETSLSSPYSVCSVQGGDSQLGFGRTC